MYTPLMGFLNYLKLSEKEKSEYKRYLKRLRDIASEQHTKMADADDLIKKGREEVLIQAVIGFHKIGVSVEDIANALNLTVERVQGILDT